MQNNEAASVRDEKASVAPPFLEALYAMPGHLIRRSQQLAVALFAEEVGPFELTPVQFAVLLAVVEQPGIDAARISSQVAFDRSTLADVLDRLSKRGLIDRHASRVDRRAKMLIATPEGIALFRRAVPAVRRVQERILAPLPEIDRAQYLMLLRKLVGLHTGEARYGDGD